MKTTIAVTADDDNTVMASPRAATITLGVTPASVELQTTQLTITIEEDDPYHIGFTPSQLTLEEGTTGQAAITITPPPLQDIALMFASPSTSQLTVDPTEVTFTANQPSKQVIIAALADVQQESTERYQISIAVATNIPATTTPLVVTIPPSEAPTISAQLGQSPIDEGDDTLLTITATNIKEPTTITLTPTGRITLSTTSITVKTDIKTTAIVTADDDNTVMASPRQATITLSVAPASINLQTTTLALIIKEDDPYQIGFAPARITLEEGATMAATITITPPPLQDIALTLASQSTSQLTISPTDVTLTANQSSKQVIISAIDDNRPDMQQTYEINAAITNNVLASITTQLMVTIPANDTPTISFTQAAANTLEEESIVITINSAPPPTEPVQATIAFNEGTLTADRIASPSFPTTVTIQAGAPSTQITITPLDDQIEQPDQSATLTLTLASPFTQLGTPNRLVLTIAASDQPNSITLIPTELTLQEGTTGTLTLTAGQLNQATTITLTSIDPDNIKLLTDPLADPQEAQTQISVVLTSAQSTTIALYALDDERAELDEHYLITATAQAIQINNNPNLTTITATIGTKRCPHTHSHTQSNHHHRRCYSHTHPHSHRRTCHHSHHCTVLTRQ